jgi:hypothetical protein
LIGWCRLEDEEAGAEGVGAGDGDFGDEGFDEGFADLLR